MELINQVFNSQFAIGNNIDPSVGSITVELPIVPALYVLHSFYVCSGSDSPPSEDYTIEAVNISNINQIYAQTSTFPIGATITSSGSASSTVSVTGTNTNTLAS